MTTCPNCKTMTGAPDWKAKAHTLWSNGYGNCKRVFCDVCGQWTDVTTKYGSSVELTTVSIRIVHAATEKDGQL